MDRTLVDPLVGTVLDGRYRIRGRIARGGMATVYDAVDERLERTVAVKVMHPTYAADPLFIDRFIREAKSTARLNHPNVVAVFDQGSHDGLAFLVMEQVAGHTLRDLLTERGRLSIAESVSVLESVLDALAAAHRSGLVHRDVKPENVLIGHDGVVKVADFGLARVVESATHTATGGVVMGTVAYVSPEQIISGQSDTRSDVYSAGIMFFEMLTGTVPFGGDSAVNIAFLHVNSDIPAISERVVGVPHALDELVVRATRREPGSRPSDAGAFLAELRLVSDELGLPHVAVSAPVHRPQPDPNATRMVPRSYPAGPPTSIHSALDLPDGPPRPSRRRNGMIALAVLLVLGIVAASAGWWLGAGRYTSTPPLLALSQQQAETKAKQAGLTIEYGKAQFSETVKAGLVLSQDPAPNGRILDGNPITVILSKGPERAVVPPVKGLTEAEATKALTDLNLKVNVKVAFDDAISQGSAINTDPAAGQQLTPGSAVTLFISNGTQPLQLPDLRGQTKDEAQEKVKKLGLQVRFERAGRRQRRAARSGHQAGPEARQRQPRHHRHADHRRRRGRRAGRGAGPAQQDLRRGTGRAARRATWTSAGSAGATGCCSSCPPRVRRSTRAPRSPCSCPATIGSSGRQHHPIGAHVPASGGLGEACRAVCRAGRRDGRAGVRHEPARLGAGGRQPGAGRRVPCALRGGRHPGLRARHVPAQPRFADRSETVTHSVATLRHTAERGRAIGARGVVFHAGSAVAGTRREEAMAQLRANLLPLLDALPEDGPDLLVEPTAGGGFALAARLEDLGPYFDAVDRHPRLGVCLDTCHVWAAGHDLAAPGGMKTALDTLVDTVGEDRLRLVHANDSKDTVGSLRDRHETLGAGQIGLDAFADLFTHPASRGVPIVVETPSGDDGSGHAADIAALAQFRDAL